MATERVKILGQVALPATMLTAVYTVPSGGRAVVSSIVFCNRAATSTTFRLSCAIQGQADHTGQYTHYDVVLPANETYIATVGATFSTLDEVRAYAGSANVTVTVFGAEIS